MYARQARPIPLRVDRAAVGLHACAWTSADKHAGAIFAVNPKAEPIECSFEFAGFSGTVRMTKADILGDTLDARQPEAINHSANPERIKIKSVALSTNHITMPAFSVTSIECAT